MLVPLLGATWLVGSHNVTVQVDGQVQAVTTHARTVGELLDRMGVTYGEADELVPDARTPLRDGMVVELVHAREITLLVGGEEETVLVTALSVDEVIDQLRSRRDVSRRSVVRTSRLLPVHTGMTVEVLNPMPVTVVVAGRSREVVTDAATVDGVLERLDIDVDADDRVSPGLAEQVESGLRIVVERVDVRRVTREVAVAFATEERPTDSLPRGQQREIQAGSDGLAAVTERVTMVDGMQESRVEIRREVLRAPRPRIVEVGTGAPEQSEPEPATSDAEPSEQHSPAQSSGSEERSSSRSATGEASYYHHPDEGLTAAHRTLPFGTLVTVTNLANGQSVQVTINDRGPFIEGRIIDLNEPAFERIASTATGVIDVRITW